jgi:hypothetical protein
MLQGLYRGESRIFTLTISDGDTLVDMTQATAVRAVARVGGTVLNGVKFSSTSEVGYGSISVGDPDDHNIKVFLEQAQSMALTLNGKLTLEISAWFPNLDYPNEEQENRKWQFDVAVVTDAISPLEVAAIA